MQEDNKKVSSSENKPSFGILDLFIVFFLNMKRIVVLTGLITLISIIFYFFVFDLIYLSSASIKSSNTKSGISGLLDASIPDIGGLDEIGIGGGKSAKELAAYEEILKSRRCIESLILKFDLMNRDEYRFMEDAVKDFRDNRMEVSIEKLPGIMSIGVYDKDPIIAKEMVEFLLVELNKINIEMSVLEARNNREFIEQRYFQSKKDLAGAEDTLKSFQLVYGIAPDMQIKASAQSVFTLEAELKSEEVKLDVVKKLLSVEQPEVKLQEAKVNSLRDKISNIQSSTDLNDFLRLGNSPQIALSFLRLQRDLEIQTKILTFLLPLYEQAKIEEKRETPTVLVLDKPYVAERKKKPKRLTMVIIWTIVGFVSLNIIYLAKSRIGIYKELISSRIKSVRE